MSSQPAVSDQCSQASPSDRSLGECQASHSSNKAIHSSRAPHYSNLPLHLACTETRREVTRSPTEDTTQSINSLSIDLSYCIFYRDLSLSSLSSLLTFISATVTVVESKSDLPELQTVASLSADLISYSCERASELT